MATAIFKNIFHLGNCLLLVVSFYLTGCYLDESFCPRKDRFVPLGSNAFIDLYKTEPLIRYLRVTKSGNLDTMYFQTRLDTQYIIDDPWVECDRCSAIYEVVQVRFLSDTPFYNMKTTYSRCSKGKVTVGGRRHDVPIDSGFRTRDGADSFLMNDSLGFYYYVRDSQYQLRLLP